MSGERSIAVIIATYGRPKLAPALVNALLPQCSQGDSIIVVWQGTDAPGPFPESPIIRSVKSSPPNLPLARNCGLANSLEDIVLYLDDDVVPEQGLLEAHRNSFDSPTVGGVAGYIDEPKYYSTECRIPVQYDERCGDLRQNFKLHQSQDTMSVCGGNMSFRRSVLEEVGGFDRSFERNGLWEEVDCSFRIRARGYRLRYCADARVKHMSQPDGGCHADRQIRYLYHQFANTSYFACKHAPRAYIRSWLTFWKYRLEYLTRTGKRTGKKYRHDPVLVAAGMTGAAAGIARYYTRRRTGKACEQ